MGLNKKSLFFVMIIFVFLILFTGSVSATDTTAPTVTNVDPASGTSNVPGNKVINVTFSEPMQHGYDSVELKDSNSNVIPITQSLGSRVLTITPNDYLDHGGYTLILHTGCYKDLAGNNLAVYTSTFTVESTAPTVIAVDPDDDATGIPGNKQIKVSFSEPMQQGNRLVDLKDSNGNVIPITQSLGSRVLTITPNDYLNHGTYTLTLHTGCYNDLANNYLNLWSSNFAVESTAPTVTDIDPDNGATNIPATKIINVTFSELMQQGNRLVDLKDSNGNVIPITQSLGSRVLTITPNDNLNHGTYTLTLHSGCYNDLANNYLNVWSSTFTVESTAPTVTDIDPDNGATNIPINKQIKVTFSETVQSGTGSVQLKDSNNNIVSITKSLANKVLTIIPSNLSPGPYILYLYNGCYKDLANNNLATFTSSFTVDNIPPSVISCDPVNNAVNVPLNKTILVTFNEPIIGGNNQIELRDNNGSTISTVNTINGNVLTITPSTLFSYGKIYTLHLLAGSYKDLAGNLLGDYNYSFAARNLVLNLNTNQTYSTIQDAVNDASPNDIIQPLSGTYIENILISKTLTIMPVSGSRVIVQALISSSPVFNLTSNGIIIQGMTIRGSTNNQSAVYINSGASNCIINGNTITNNYVGINNVLSNNTRITNNNITNYSYMGINMGKDHLYTNNTLIQNNIITTGLSGITYGIHFGDCKNTTIIGNSILWEGSSTTGVTSLGINAQDSTANINFNRIAGFTYCGLRDQNSTVNYSNNWWGTNNPIYFTNGDSNGDVCDPNAISNPYPYLKLKISSNKNPTGLNNTCSITADLTHDNNGKNTSNSGSLPDGIPINFTSTLGTIANPGYTRYGKAVTTFTGSIYGNATINATLDNQIVSTMVNLVKVYNNRTLASYTNIQSAIDDALSGDTIIVEDGTYNENITLNKKLTLKSDVNSNSIIKGVVTISSNGSNSVLQDLIVNGHVNLFANNCNIIGNRIIGNGSSGVIASTSINNFIFNNTITANGYDGINSTFSNNTYSGNEIFGCHSGIYSYYSADTIDGNDLTGNYYGIWTYNAADLIHFNRISGNTYGLRNDLGIVDATDNWWGNNNDPSTESSNINLVSGSVNSSSWLVLSVNTSSTNSGGKTSVTADLTHDNTGSDTSSNGHIPDGIPVNFNTNFGTIIGTAYTLKGKSSTILNLGTTQNATVTCNATLDNQNVSTTSLIITGVAVLNITSTAVDNATGSPLNTTYTIPLNNSVTWLSVLWINRGMFTDEMQIIIDGVVVQDKYFTNPAYTKWQNSYPTSLFDAIKYVNQHLPFIATTELPTFWNNLTTQYNLTSEELTFIKNHSQDFTDNITFDIVYSGSPGLKLNVTDSHSNIFNLNFPGNAIKRTSQVIYVGSQGEGVKSFAIATTDVTADVLQYWWNQYSSYQTGDVKNVAYNTFLTALTVEYLHDQIADNITTLLNVTWSRTSPIIVSVAEDPQQIYVTLECDHGMGMTVVGQFEDIYVFNFMTSFYISNIEDDVMSNAYNLSFNSVTMDLLYRYNNNKNDLESIEEDGFIIVKSISNDNFLVFDSETGMVRDIDTVHNFYGGYYFYKQTTNMINYITLIGFKYLYWQISNPWDLGNFQFLWNGTGNVFISSNGKFLADISADNILEITGPMGSKTVVGTQGALDITDILDANAGLQNLHLILTDTDQGFIATSPLYILWAGIDRQDLELPQLFPTPSFTWPPSPFPPLPLPPANFPPTPWDQNSPEIPIDPNTVFKDFWRDTINPFISIHNYILKSQDLPPNAQIPPGSLYIVIHTPFNDAEGNPYYYIPWIQPGGA
ncbi:parallel beta-helix repeat [Methanobacterium lacus]|uniref:Parallel beta-helix repeat n=1 Tax=Methanobacterium lacus (strain AL-21) TaxID=877455 RepID=F0T622_METLA|nr:Ig-like domain-containing protein [Methanobacterium lacus]ADZ10529.1 parallel beta-helix repeat [Methanobacterium lacus]